MKLEPMTPDGNTAVGALGREERRAMCIHEAGHAVLHALGGAIVYRVAVAPVGATEWTTTARKGAALADLWGVCEVSDLMAGWCLKWHEEDRSLVGDRSGFVKMLRVLEGHTKGSQREQYRQTRAHVCGLLAGPAAEQMFNGEEPYLSSEGEWDKFGDCTKADGLAWLLPWRTDREHLEALTVQTLRNAEVWALVLRLADALEQAGDLSDLRGYLPTPMPNWPPSARARRPVPLQVRLP